VKHILFLAERMSIGFGVSVVIGELTTRLAKRGWLVSVGCRQFDSYFSERCNVIKLEPNSRAIDSYASKHNVDFVIAHTTPYFEILPKLNGSFETWAWEHGDPTPSLFPFDRDQRQKFIDYKRNHVYPHVDHVIAISKFVQQEINWPLAKVIYNGCGHIKIESPKKNLYEPLNVGALMRLGEGERYYKGGDRYIELAKQFALENIPINFGVLGRGTPEEGNIFKQAGIKTHLNATEEEKSKYLQDLDVFLSLSLWEGFNLPLVEAQASGKLAIAFDTGAHPEVTPFIVTNLNELKTLLLSLDKNRERLYQYTVKSQQFCLKKFNWETTIDMTLDLLSSQNSSTMD
jgi:glycosyltransferase involved in cell wall biosynthesis